MKPQTVLILAGIAGAVALAAYVMHKGVAGATAGAVGGAVALAGQVGQGVVLGVGDAVGVPRTDQSACDQAIAEGRTWDASFACPAGTFLSHLFN